MTRMLILGTDRADCARTLDDTDLLTTEPLMFVTPRSLDAARGYSGAGLVITPRMMLDPRLAETLVKLLPCFLTTGAPPAARELRACVLCGGTAPLSACECSCHGITAEPRS